MSKRIGFVALFSVLVIAFMVACSKSSAPSQKIEFLFDWKMTAPFSPYLLAKELGYYAEEGIEMEFIEGQGAETSAKLVGSGRYKVGTSNAAATAIAVDNGIPIVSVAIVDQLPVTAIFSLRQSAITKPQDLVGKKIGVRYFDISHKEYLAMLRASNIDPKRIEEINVGFDPQPLLEKQVDALYNYAFFMPVQLRTLGYEINTILVKDYGVRGFGSNIIVNRKWASENSALVRKFVRATRKGWESALANPEQAIEVLARYAPATDKAVALANLREEFKWVKIADRKLFEQTTEGWAEALAGYRSLEMVKSDIKPDAVFTTEYQPE